MMSKKKKFVPRAEVRGEKKCEGWREGLKPMHPPEKCFHSPQAYPSTPPVVVGLPSLLIILAAKLTNLSKRNKREKQYETGRVNG